MAKSTSATTVRAPHPALAFCGRLARIVLVLAVGALGLIAGFTLYQLLGVLFTVLDQLVLGGHLSPETIDLLALGATAAVVLINLCLVCRRR